MYTTDGCVHCTREMKKKILVWLMGFGLVLGLCACGQEKKTVSVSRSVLKAYTEYYNNFFGEHYLDDIGYLQYLYQTMGLEDVSYLQYDEEYGGMYTGFAMADCSAKIVMIDDKPVLAIADLVEFEYGDETANYIYDVYFLRYEGRKVVEQTVIHDLVCEDDGFILFSMDGKIYLDTIYNEVYCISGDAYEEIEETGLGESGNGASGLFSIYWGNLVYSMLAEGNIIENDSGTDFETKYGINGTDFTDWLEYLSEQEISNSIEFDILYGKYLIDKGFSQTFEIVCWQDGVYYYYYDEACMEMLSTETEDEFATTTAVALDIKDMGEVEEEVEETKKITDGSLVMYGYDVDCTDIVLPEEIMGYSVTGIDFQPYDTSIVLCFEEYPYANVNIELHENITYISPIIFNTIYCEEGSYAHQYAEEMGNPYILGNIEKNRNDELIYPEKYRMSENIKKYTSCVNENSRYGEDAYYCFVDINKDDVYELLVTDQLQYDHELYYLDKDGNAQCIQLGIELEIDKNGVIIDTDVSTSVDNIPDSRLWVYNQKNGLYEVIHCIRFETLHDNWGDVVWEEYDYENIKSDNNLFAYYVDDVQYASYAEAYDIFNGYYAYGTEVEVSTEFHETIQEAYKNIGIIEYGYSIYHIEAMSCDNGMLYIKDDTGEEISYSLAKDCIWDYDCPFDENFYPITYEEIESDWTACRTEYLKYGEELNYSVTAMVKDNQVVRVYTVHN